MKFKIALYFVLTKAFYALFAFFVFSKFTSLADSNAYLDGHYLERDDIFSTAYLMSFVGNAFGEVFANVIACVISVLAICYLIFKDKNLNKNLCFYLLLAMTPSFGVWTSILSKECFVLLGFSLLIGFIVDVLENKRLYPNVFQCLGGVILVLFKPHMVLPVIITYFIIVNSRVFRNSYVFLVMVFTYIVVFSCIIYSLTDVIYEYTKIIPYHFSMSSNSTRINDFWIEKYDFFYYMPIGMVIGFVGPKLDEALNNITMLPYFFEGLWSFLLLIFIFIRIAKPESGEVNVYYATIAIFFILTVLIAHYPFGVFNPGSAVRYRSGYYFPIFVFLNIIKDMKLSQSN